MQLRQTALRGASLRSGRVAKAARVVRAAAAADRPLWFPGNPAPAYLDGSLAGDFGFDPLKLAEEPATLRWMVQAELQNGRWAMLGVAGILFTALGAEAGLGFPQWYDAGKVAIATSPFSFQTLIGVQFLLFAWVESKRLADLLYPGSQGDGSFFGITDDFKGKENGYPGGRLFDPMGLSRGDPAKYKEYKEKEIKNGRLAMVAALGFFSQYAATGKGPVQNLVDHVSDPTHVTAATNGISVPFYL
ncbi:MAG: light-harvesting complex I protein [Monoraphidium minutum]|nr:MAG: light-harvesting complex I protein [Monoraphidium minutum]